MKIAVWGELNYILVCSQMFTIYIKRAAEAFGITHTREIHEKAIEVLPDRGARLYMYMWIPSYLKLTNNFSCSSQELSLHAMWYAAISSSATLLSGAGRCV